MYLLIDLFGLGCSLFDNRRKKLKFSRVQNELLNNNKVISHNKMNLHFLTYIVLDYFL